jgi:hypothetical protein
MSDCKWEASDRPRVIPGRHGGECSNEACAGCAPCPRPHCRVCDVAHDVGTCPECMAASRETLHDIARKCGSLPDEVEHRGVQGEAMFLLGPAANPEARGHLEASVSAGRVSEDYLAAAMGETHPVWVLGTWSMLWRDALDHDDDAAGYELAELVDYLDRTMTYMGGYEHVPFEDFARDLRRCLTHLDSVLHDQAQGDRANVGCFDCGRSLERKLTRAGFEDVWTCQGCHRRYTYAEYNFALRATLEATTMEESA